MNGPTGLIFAMRSRYTNQTGNEAFFNEADAQFSGTDGATSNCYRREQPCAHHDATGGGTTATNYDLAGNNFSTSEMEALGDGASTAFMEMAFSIDRIAVSKSRALRADYSVELAQDLKAIHGLDAESELANIPLLRSLLKSTVRLSVPYIAVLRAVLRQTSLTLAYSTLTLIPTADGRLRSSKVSCSRSSAMPTQSHKKLVAERATLSSPLLT